MTQAFKVFSAKTLKQQDKPSLRRQLSKQIQKVKENKQREKENVNKKDRGVEL